MSVSVNLDSLTNNHLNQTPTKPQGQRQHDALLTHCQSVLADYSATRYWLGFSGGRDSHVLLDVMVGLRNSGFLSAPITAIHVNHRLHAESQAWVKHCQAVCEAYDVDFICETVTTQPQTGESIEAFAREQRYALIEKHLTDGELFLSAHHQRDQAETFLLQLMRGAGVDGLRAMPLMKAFGAGRYLRPLLACDYDKICAYAEQQQLRFINDPSNDDRHFDRNFIRHEVLALLQQRFPQATRAIARSAAWLAEIPDTETPQQLLLAPLKQLSESEKKQRIRAFLKAKLGHAISQTQTQTIVDNHLTAAADKHPQLVIGNQVVRRFNGEIVLTADLPKDDIAYLLTVTSQVTLGEHRDFSPLARLAWQTGQGIIPQNKPYYLKALDGGLRFHPHQRLHSTTVKKLLHEAAIAPWLRPYWQGLFCDDVLIAIPQIGVAKAYYEISADAFTPLWIIAPKFVKL